MAENKKILVVFGATGIQGGSVAKTILSDPITSQQFCVRAVTRDPSKPAAVAVKNLGADLVTADMEDKGSLRLALKDAFAVFAVTNFLETMDTVAETRQGKNVADIAKELNVEHLIWSTLPNVTQATNNKLTGVLHFDSKALVADHIRSLSIPYTFVQVGTYSGLLLDFLAPLPTGSYGLLWPEPASAKTYLPVVDPSADLGKFIKGILLNPAKSKGRLFKLAQKLYSLEEIAETLSRLGLDTTFQPLDKNTFVSGLVSKGFPESFHESMVQVMEFVAKYSLFTYGDIEEGHQLLSDPLVTLEESLKRNPGFLNLIKQ